MDRQMRMSGIDEGAPDMDMDETPKALAALPVKDGGGA